MKTTKHGNNSTRYKKKYVQVDTAKLQKVQASGDYWVQHPLGPEPKEFDKRQFFIFKWTGDSIEGILCKPIVNFRRNQSYPVQQEDGKVLEIFGNRWLHRIIRENELVGSRVKVTYVGLRRIPGYWRSQKIYSVHKVERGQPLIAALRKQKKKSGKQGKESP